MNNPIKIWNELRNIYLKYIDSGLPLNKDGYIKERRLLYEQSTAICQPPIIELVPKYEEVSTLRDSCLKNKINLEFAEFARCGLFKDYNGIERKLYIHQEEALKSALVNRKNIVATTGTGSGKTECFLLPVIADLINESEKWETNRTRAVRTLILYPLNALAEDQMIRLRKSLNSRSENKSGALDWLDKNRSGHRFYFGRYTGKTPISGNSNQKSRRSEYKKEKDLHEKEWTAVVKASQEAKKNDLLYHIPCMDENSAEMWDRWSMQETPPDILITNYSMLNIMLTRSIEDPIFEQTKKWLSESKENRFHLVVDEMHTYKGTAGTEVAYLIRQLLDRLGLNPDHEQIQFLASSASMQENERTKEYLCSFFGTNRENYKKKFKLLSNPPQNKIITEPSSTLPIDEFSEYSKCGSLKKLQQNLNCNSPEDIVHKYQIINWLKYIMQDDNGNLIAAKSTILTKKLFGEITEQTSSALEGILTLLCKSKASNNTALQPIRSHNFFRNIDGLWACSNKDCSEIDQQFKWEGRKVGKLYRNPGQTICNCGSKIYEVLICRSCGELFLKGYETNYLKSTYLIMNQPCFENKRLIRVIWPNKRVSTKDKKGTDWKTVNLSSKTGEIDINKRGKSSVFIPDDEYPIDHPNYCPNCSCKTKIEDQHSFPAISSHNTGVQKVNQVMADALMRILKENNNNNDPAKLILFSDSRQAAAKLAAGIELDHYRDVLRQVVLNSLEAENSNIELLKKYRSNGIVSLSENERTIFRSFENNTHLNRIKDLIRNEKDTLLNNDEINNLNNLLNKQLPELKNIECKVNNEILKLGINPAGPKPSCYQSNETIWKELFDWNTKPVKYIAQGNETHFYDRIIKACKIEQLITIFAHKSRSFESLKVGFVTADIKDVDIKYSQFVDIAIRIMGERWRIIGQNKNFIIEGFPKEIKEFAKRAEIDFVKDDFIELLRNNKIIDSKEIILTGDNLYFKRSQPGDEIWICEKCGAVHLHPSCGICYNCYEKLETKKSLTKNDLEDSEDYYLYLTKKASPYRLRCEELTGQTSKEDTTKRQRQFQGIFLKEENRIVDTIDLLSVTTTMEAGVDIGSLSAVMMGNVPPQRFNYQQRVGRAGRRGNALSIALTIAKGNSHDQTHYFQTERMVSATPKDPYLEIRSSEIAERIIIRQILQRSFKNINIEGVKDNIHGEFGLSEKWYDNRVEVSEWIKNNKFEINNIIESITKGTKLNKDSSEIEKYITKDLVKRIDNIVKNNRDYPQKALSERLSNAGLLPMFGFPTRVRLLYHKQPKKIPATEVIDRDLDIAISSFAPGSEIVKDKKLFTSVGFVNYKRHLGSIIEIDALNKLDTPIYKCSNCNYISIGDREENPKCVQCGEELFEKVTACSPLGFCVDFSANTKDFNGRFDYQQGFTSVSLDAESDLNYLDSINNLSYRTNTLPHTGRVHTINDNRGQLFKVGILKGTKQHVVRSAFDKKRQNSLPIIRERKYALIASKTTGVLATSIKQTNEFIDLTPTEKNKDNWQTIKSAYISWGYLLQKAICDFLDIDTNEIEVGYQINKDKNGEVFFVERLENGAGYCNYLSGRIHKDVPYKAMIKPFLEDSDFYKHLTNSEDHLNQCSSSCYDCLRDYNNQQYHTILDWRLGLDLARISYKKDTFIDFTSIYWKDHINILANQFESYTKIKDGIFIIENRGKRILITHPFWSKKYINTLKSEIKFDDGINIIRVSEIIKE